MKTLASFAGGGRDVPGATAWLIGELGEARGKQELFTRQSPERLRVLREHAVVESAVSSNRIEGVEIDPTRVRSVVLGQDKLRDRNEEEVRGYRLALKLIHEDAPALAVDEGDAVVPQVNALMDDFAVRVLTQDWHPEDHLSFAANHAGAAPFSMTEMPYGPQVLWPRHCVQGTEGAAFHRALRTNPVFEISQDARRVLVRGQADDQTDIAMVNLPQIPAQP